MEQQQTYRGLNVGLTTTNPGHHVQFLTRNCTKIYEQFLTKKMFKKIDLRTSHKISESNLGFNLILEVMKLRLRSILGFNLILKVMKFRLRSIQTKLYLY